MYNETTKQTGKIFRLFQLGIFFYLIGTQNVSLLDKK